jgi:hypothetical protein
MHDLNAVMRIEAGPETDKVMKGFPIPRPAYCPTDIISFKKWLHRTGFTQKEAAERLEIPTDTIKSMLKRRVDGQPLTPKVRRALRAYNQKGVPQI